MSKGFTLIEILISLAIMAVLFSTLLLGKTESEKNLVLQRSAYQLAQDLRETQGKSMGAEKSTCNIDNKYSFGIAFNVEWTNYYILFADCDGNKDRNNNGTEDIRKIYLEKGVVISNLSPSSFFSVVFKAPEPVVYINKIDWNQEAIITFILNFQTKKIKINSAGRIEIE